jgi:hypothetical protein
MAQISSSVIVEVEEKEEIVLLLRNRAMLESQRIHELNETASGLVKSINELKKIISENNDFDEKHREQLVEYQVVQIDLLIQILSQITMIKTLFQMVLNKNSIKLLREIFKELDMLDVLSKISMKTSIMQARHSLLIQKINESKMKNLTSLKQELSKALGGIGFYLALMGAVVMGVSFVSVTSNAVKSILTSQTTSASEIKELWVVSGLGLTGVSLGIGTMFLSDKLDGDSRMNKIAEQFTKLYEYIKTISLQIGEIDGKLKALKLVCSSQEELSIDLIVNINNIVLDCDSIINIIKTEM